MIGWRKTAINSRILKYLRGFAVTSPIAFIDLQAQRRRIADKIETAIKRVLEHGAYVMGPEILEMEKQLAQWGGVRHALACASGTDALVLALMARGIGLGDAVMVPSFTFVATAEAVVLAGATPVFVDILPDTLCMDPQSLERAIKAAAQAGLKPKAVIPVDLFGQPADYPALTAVAGDLLMIADAAQSFGAKLNGKPVGSMAAMTTTSFFPAKPLGCYGDGGAVLTDDDELIDILRSIRSHGQGKDRYEHVRIGVNGRMDTMQAAIMLEKLAIFGEEIELRDAVARRYTEALADVVETPVVISGGTSVWAQYTFTVDDRDGVMKALQGLGVPTGVYYPTPIHMQPPYAHYPADPQGLTVTEAKRSRVLSLPMHPYLDAATQDRVIAAVRQVVGAK
ncbi:MAG: DegT/DnrJ/EryC1/StrS aminotransferase family protein [Rhodospirillaceae bacterium]|nr:DegT/DnrJ/EryC1/StrS aminotransferase family protein [Rhodospirillales bacterium]